MDSVSGPQEVVGRSSLDSLLDRLDVAVFRSTPEGRLLDASPAWLRLFGFSSLEQARASGLASLYVRPEDRDAVIGDVLAVGEVRDQVLHLHRLDGQPLWLCAAEVATRLPDGSVVIDGILVDTGERVNAARRLEQQAEQFRLLMEQANVAIFLADAATGMLIYANRRAQELIGRGLDEILRMHQLELHPAEARATYAEIFREHAAADSAVHADLQIVDAHGARIPVSISAMVVELAGRKVVQGVFHDLRTLHRAHQALEESAYRYRQLVELSPDAIAVHAGGNIVFANPEAVRLLGASGPEELLGRSILDMVHPDSLELVRERVRRMMGSGEPAPLAEECFVRVDGTTVEVEAAAGPFTYQGQPAIQVVFRDVSERKRMRAELERTQAHQAAILAGLPVAVYSAEVPSEFDIAWISESVELLTGFPAARFLAERRFWRQRVHPEDLDRVLAEFRSQIMTGGEARIEYRFQVADDTYRWLAEHARKVGSRNGFIEVIGFIADVHDRRQAEHALRESEEKYRALVEEILEAILELDAAGRVIFISSAIERITGHSAEEVEGRHFSEFIHPGDLGELEASFRLVLSGNLHPSEYRVICKDGGYRWVRSSSQPIVEDGQVRGIRGVLVDITERREAEAALQRSARRLEAMHEVDLAILAARSRDEITVGVVRTLRQLIPAAERATIIVFHKDRNEIQILAVDAAPELDGDMGHGPGVGRLLAAVMERGLVLYVPDVSAHLDMGPDVQRVVERGVRSMLFCGSPLGEGLTAHLILSSRSVDAFTAEHRGVVGEVGGVLGVALTQARLRERVEEQQRTLALLVSQLPDGIVLMGEDGQLALANPAAVDYLALLGHRDVRAPVGRLGGLTLAQVLAPRPGDLPHELASEGPDPRLFEVRARSTVGGPERAWILLIHDATRERQMARSLEQQDRLAVIGHLAGGLAHDFNNYLTAILTHAELLLRDPQQPRAAQDALRVIKEQCERSARLVRSILDFSRGSASERHSLDLGRFVAEVVQILARTIPERIRIEVEAHDAESCPVLADATQLQQVIMNVAVNARDAMPGQGRLRLSVRPETVVTGQASPVAGMGSGVWAHLSVEDTGAGIKPEHLPHIFEPFFTTKPPGHGTGLGLSQVYGLVRQHDGFVTAESQVGVGTTIHIFLPREATEAAEQQPVEAEPEGGHGELVVLAEDEAEVRAAIEQALVLLGYRVVAVEDGQRALDFLRAAGGASLLLTDLTMPVMSGDELVHRVHQELPALPVVVLTGYAAGRLDSLRELGAVTTAQKPLSIAELAQVVRAAIR